MLNLLHECLKKNSYYFEDKIGNLHGSCCISSMSVLSFDKVKTKFFQEMKGQQLTSMDAAIFSLDDQTLFFVEMISYYTSNSNDESFYQTCSQDIMVKLFDSIAILLGLVGYTDIDKKFYKFFFGNNGIKIKSILLTDMNEIDKNRFQLSNLDKLHTPSLSRKIHGDIQLLNCEDFEYIFNKAS